jgi:hypothetical protein
LWNDQLVIEGVRGNSQKFLEYNENENKTYQNFGDTEKAVLREKFIAVSTYFKKRAKQRDLK